MSLPRGAALAQSMDSYSSWVFCKAARLSWAGTWGQWCKGAVVPGSYAHLQSTGHSAHASFTSAHISVMPNQYPGKYGEGNSGTHSQFIQADTAQSLEGVASCLKKVTLRQQLKEVGASYTEVREKRVPDRAHSHPPPQGASVAAVRQRGGRWRGRDPEVLRESVLGVLTASILQAVHTQYS